MHPGTGLLSLDLGQAMFVLVASSFIRIKSWIGCFISHTVMSRQQRPRMMMEAFVLYPNKTSPLNASRILLNVLPYDAELMLYMSRVGYSSGWLFSSSLRSTPGLGCFDGLRVLELRAPDVVPEFGCHTEPVAAVVSRLRFINVQEKITHPSSKFW